MKKKEQKKINLLIFPGNYLPNIGGLETHVDEYVKYQSQNPNYKITIFTPNLYNSKPIEKKFENKVTILRYPAVFVVPNFPIGKFWKLSFWKMYFNLYKKKYDIVMTRTRFFPNTTLGTMFAKFRFKPTKLVHVEHGSEFVILDSKLKSNIAYLYDMIFGKLTFKLADQNISISKAVYNFIRREFQKKGHLPLIQRGVDFSIYDNSKENYDLSKYERLIKIGFVGRLYKWKGVENSIEAFKQLDKKLQEKAVLIITGDGEDFKRLQKIAKDVPNVVMLGGVEFKYAISIFKQLDIYVHSAYPGGGLSNSLLQAMYCKCGVVASPHEGANEVIDNNTGISLKDNSIKNLKKGMEILIQDKKLREELGKSAHQKIKNEFSWDYVVEKYEKEFERILK